MGDDLLPILARFHREIVLPDIKRVVGDLREEMDGRFGALDALAFSSSSSDLRAILSSRCAVEPLLDALRASHEGVVLGLERVEALVGRSIACDARGRLVQLTQREPRGAPCRRGSAR